MPRGGARRGLLLALFGLAAGLLAAGLLTTAPRAAVDKLPALNAAIGETSVSGISSGGYMAVQMQVVHASIMRGAGVVAGGPFACAEGGADQALGTCMEGTPDARALAGKVRELAKRNQVDAPEHLARQQVWLFTGSNDGVVRTPVVRSLEAFYQEFIAPERIFLKDSLAAGHVFASNEASGACAVTGPPFLANCAYDAAGELLQHIYGRLQPPAAAATASPAGRLVEFDQRPFAAGSARSNGLADTGFLFIPRSCEEGAPCRVHVAFHGCRQDAATVGRAFVEHAGYNRWAAANNIAVLYPQTKATWGFPFNPKACWDWWGYTGSDYASRNGKQIRAVRGMLDQLASGTRSGSVGTKATNAAQATGDAAATSATAATAAAIPALQGETSDDALAVRWPAGLGSVRLVQVYGGQRQLLATLPAGQTAYVVRGLPAASRLRIELETTTPAGSGGGASQPAPAALEISTARKVPACDPYFSDNLRHVQRGRAYVLWGRAKAIGSGDDLGWWNVWSESQVVRTASGYRAGICQ